MGDNDRDSSYWKLEDEVCAWWILETCESICIFDKQTVKMWAESLIVLCRLMQDQTPNGHKTEVLKGNSIDRALNDASGVHP